MTRHKILLTALLLVPAGALEAQSPPDTVRWTGIVAVVGDSIVTDLDLQESLQLWMSEQQQQPPPEGTPEFDQLMEVLLEDRITTLLLVQAALRDTTVIVPEADIALIVDQQIDTVRALYRTQAEFEEALRGVNLTPETYRENMTASIRRTQLARAYITKVQQDRRPPPVSDAEIREFFAEQGDQVPTIPPSVIFEQIVIPVEASDSAQQVAQAKADSILTAINDGEDFAEMARRFSEDGSAQFGGDLGWFRPGQMVPEFERATFDPLMRAGTVTGPVKTVFGFHLIKLDRIRGNERSARHILIRPVITDADSVRTRALADDIASQWSGGGSFDALRRAHGDRDELPRLGPIPLDSLSGGYEALQGANEGQVVGPFMIGQERGTPKYVLARVSEVTEARLATVDDYRAQIQNILATRKLNEEIVAELRRRTHIEIRRPGGRPDR